MHYLDALSECIVLAALKLIFPVTSGSNFYTRIQVKIFVNLATAQELTIQFQNGTEQSGFSGSQVFRHDLLHNPVG